ncbi:hypothetical protein BLNAU_23576 [Blattamonas nauphoetae]|uniref:Uncharacterized protein n=1 Tax=Blattamonas nauphoetae TaxID=2049346 RepID=A0ABQ9WQ90_9EUKA|nr:hypothetical protein BLNAU_23576 [Blattamonas nauphoetae]
MKLIRNLIENCSVKSLLALVNADLIPQLINTLNPLSLSFTEAGDIHISLMKSINKSIWLATPYGLYRLKRQDQNEQQAVHETVLKQVLVPSEKYISLLCVNRYSIIDGEQSPELITLLPRLLRICAYYQPTMEVVLHMPVFLTIPSCHTYFENENSIWSFLSSMVEAQWRWNITKGEVRKMGKTVLRNLRMEGFEDMIAEKLQNDQLEDFGRRIVRESIEWNNLQGMNHLRHA